MQKRFASVTAIGRKIGLNDDTGYAVAIFLALLIVSATVIGYYAFLAPPAESYNTIYLLDANKKAVNYPEVLVTNQNSTFNVYVNVENHMGGPDNQTYQVLVKITPNLSDVPVNNTQIKTFDLNLKSDDSWQDSAVITENQVGLYSFVFELWHYNQKTKAYDFTSNYCVLKIQVIS